MRGLSLLSIVFAVSLATAADPPKDADESVEKFTWQGKEKTRVVRVLDLGGEKVEFVKVPAGNFQMGSPKSDKAAESDEKPQHTVTFTKELWVAKYPVTKRQFAAFVKATRHKTEVETDGKGGHGYDGVTFVQTEKYNWKNTGWEQADRHPVVNVTFSDAEAYCKWAEEASKAKVRLLSEAEYEYANRGGTDTNYFTGDDVTSLKGYANIGDKTAKAKFSGWTVAAFEDEYVFSSPVGQFKPNGFGLHDTTGNVWSWCADVYDDKLYKRGNVTDPKVNSDSKQQRRILRGGSWADGPIECRSALRFWYVPSHRSGDIGFRLCFSSH